MENNYSAPHWCLLECFIVFPLTRQEGGYNSTYSPHHRPHKTAMRSPHNYTLYNGTPNIMALIWPYNRPSLHGAQPIPTRLQEGLKAPMSWDLLGTISKYTRCTLASDPLPYTGSKFSLTRGSVSPSRAPPIHTSWLTTPAH